jgi:hypothetical protein
MTLFAVMIEIEVVELAEAGMSLIITAQLTVCHKKVSATLSSKAQTSLYGWGVS